MQPCPSTILHEGELGTPETACEDFRSFQRPVVKDVSSARVVSEGHSSPQDHAIRTVAVDCQAAPMRGGGCVRGCGRFGPRLRTSNMRTRSSRSAGAYMPL